MTHVLEQEGDELTVEQVIAMIKATPPDPSSLHPAQGSLAQALRDAPENPTFDLIAWQHEWAVVEAEMRRIESGG